MDNPMRSAASTRAVLIDLDGTLVDSAPDIVIAANRLLGELGAPSLPFETVAGFIGRGVPNLVRRVVASSDRLAATTEAEGLAIFYRHYAESNGRYGKVYPGVIPGLVALRDLGFRLGCVTNKPLAYTVSLLERMGLAQYFGAVVAGDSLHQMKPHPAPLLDACLQLGVAPTHGAMVGDSEVDVAAGRAAGMPVYIVRYGYPGAGGLEALHPDRFIDSFTELPDLLALCPEQTGSRAAA
ncbi:MAG: phosphoglycolate phosphatase [Burkholderiaceae bacterium]